MSNTRNLPREVSLMLGVGVALAGFGPFGTFSLAPLWERLIYWPAVMLISYAWLRPAVSLVDRVGDTTPARIGAQVGASLAAAIPLTLMVWLASFRHTPSLWPNTHDFMGLYISVAFTAMLLLPLFALMDHIGVPGRGAVAAESGSPNDGAARAKVLATSVERGLLALEMQDHYVLVHTIAGNTLIHMTMKDAVRELSRCDGTQVHRSWWVSRAAIRRVESTARSLRLHLDNGLVVPVSRTKAAAIRQWARGLS